MGEGLSQPNHVPPFRGIFDPSTPAAASLQPLISPDPRTILVSLFLSPILALTNIYSPTNHIHPALLPMCARLHCNALHTPGWRLSALRLSAVWCPYRPLGHSSLPGFHLTNYCQTGACPLPLASLHSAMQQFLRLPASSAGLHLRQTDQAICSLAHVPPQKSIYCHRNILP